jgi:hypothetical protein
MSIPLENHQPRDPVDKRLIDQLVDGELRDVERRELLLRLEAQPDGWRRCALAFLEAQSWRETFGPLAAPAGTPPVAAPGAPERKSMRRRHVAHLTALAASLVAAFTLGWAMHGRSGESAPQPPFVNMETGPEVAPAASTQSALIDVAAGNSRPSGLEEPAGARDPVVKQWEQRGYHAERHQRLVSVELKDGRRLDVPVEEVRLRYVRGRTY